MIHSLKTISIAGLSALALGAGVAATAVPADAQAPRGPAVYGAHDQRGFGFGDTAPGFMGAAASTTFGYPNWPYGNAYYGGFAMPVYGPYDRYGY